MNDFLRNKIKACFKAAEYCNSSLTAQLSTLLAAGCFPPWASLPDRRWVYRGKQRIQRMVGVSKYECDVKSYQWNLASLTLNEWWWLEEAEAGALAWEQPLTQGGAFCHVPIFLPSPPPPSFACFPARALRFHGTPASPLCYPWQYPKIIENTDKSFRPHQVQHGVHGGLDSTTAAVWPSRVNQLVPSHSQEIL